MSLTVGSAGTFQGDLTFGSSLSDSITYNGAIHGGSPFKFKGSTPGENTTTWTITQPTDSRTIIVPDSSFTLNDISSVTGNTLPSNVLSSSLTSVGTLTNLALSGNLNMATNAINFGTGNNDFAISHDGSNLTAALSTGNFTMTLATNDSSSGFIVKDSGNTTIFSIDASGAGTIENLTVNNNLVISGDMTINNSESLTLSGNKTGTTSTSGVFLDQASATFNDTTTTGVDPVVATAASARLQGFTLTADTEVTVTKAATLHIASVPTASTNATITNAYAMIIEGGDVDMGGNNIVNVGDFTVENLDGTITTVDQPNITSLGTLTGLTMGGTLAMGSNNITGTGTIGGTLTTAAQTNITSLGTLTGLAVGGDLNLSGSGNIYMQGLLRMDDASNYIELKSDTNGWGRIDYYRNGAKKFESGMRTTDIWYVYDNTNYDYIIHYNSSDTLLELANLKVQMNGTSGDVTLTSGDLTVDSKMLNYWYVQNVRGVQSGTSYAYSTSTHTSGEGYHPASFSKTSAHWSDSTLQWTVQKTGWWHISLTGIHTNGNDRRIILQLAIDEGGGATVYNVFDRYVDDTVYTARKQVCCSKPFYLQSGWTIRPMNENTTANSKGWFVNVEFSIHWLAASG